MSANIDTMFSAREKPWHELGINIPSEVNAQEAFKLSGLDWKVDVEPLYLQNGFQIESAFAIVRKDKNIPLGITGNRYRPVQNQEMFNIVDKAVGEGLMSFNTAGSLGKGERVWALCRLPGRIGTEIDPIDKFVLITNSHDGTTTLSVLITPIRVVCQNTLNFALKHSKNGLFRSFRHTQSISNRAETGAKQIVELAEAGFESFEAIRKDMTSRPFSDHQMIQTILSLFKPAPDVKKVEDVSPRTLRTWNTMFHLWNKGRGADLTRNTAWGAINAVVEYTDFYRPGKDFTKSIIFGSGANLKSEALQTVMAISNTAKEETSTPFDEIFFNN